MSQQPSQPKRFQFDNVEIRFDAETGFVSLDDLWLAGSVKQAMSPLVWLSRQATQTLLERLTRDRGLPLERAKFWPRNGATKEYIVNMEHLVKVRDGKTFVCTELAVVYSMRVSQKLYRWAVAELSEISPKPGVMPDSLKTAIRESTEKPIHVDVADGTHFDALLGPVGHADHTDHGDHNDNI